MIDPITFDQLRELIILAILVIAFLAVYRSVPVDKVAMLHPRATDKSDSLVDNILLQAYDYLAMRYGGRPVADPVSDSVELPIEKEDHPRD